MQQAMCFITPITKSIVHFDVLECDSLADGRCQDLPTSEAENGMLLHLATMAPRERFELDAGVEIAASDLLGRNRDGPNTSPAICQPVSRAFDVVDQSSPLLWSLASNRLQTGSKLSASSGDALGYA